MSPLQVHDDRHFPRLYVRAEAAHAGYAAAWIADMDALLRDGGRFAVIHPVEQAPEDREDFKARGTRLKHNKARLAELCAGMLRIGPDAARREQLQPLMEGAQRACGVPQRFASDPAQAEALARGMLAAPHRNGGIDAG